MVDMLPGVAPSLIPVGLLVKLEKEAATRGGMMRATGDYLIWLDAQELCSMV